MSELCFVQGREQTTLLLSSLCYRIVCLIIKIEKLYFDDFIKSAV